MTSLDEIFNKWIDRQVNVVVDRPTGYTHPSWPDLVYETDYGFIPDTVGGDGKEVDVYVLDNSKEENILPPTIVAVLDRLDDIEFKLIASHSGSPILPEAAYAAVKFAEKHFDVIVRTRLGIARFKNGCQQH